jgi:hypothetical protein
VSVAVSFLFTIAILLIVAFGLGDILLTAFDEVSVSWTGLQDRSIEASAIRLGAPSGQSVARKLTVQLTLTNPGKHELGQFDKWDVIFEVRRAGDSLLDLHSQQSAWL